MYRYRLDAMSSCGGEYFVYHVSSDVLIPDDLLQVAGMVLNGEANAEVVKELLAESQSHVSVFGEE